MEGSICDSCGGGGEVLYQDDDDRPSEFRRCSSCEGSGLERAYFIGSKRERGLKLKTTAMDRAIDALEKALIKFGVFKK